MVSVPGLPVGKESVSWARVISSCTLYAQLCWRGRKVENTEMHTQRRCFGSQKLRAVLEPRQSAHLSVTLRSLPVTRPPGSSS